MYAPSVGLRRKMGGSADTLAQLRVRARVYHRVVSGSRRTEYSLTPLGEQVSDKACRAGELDRTEFAEVEAADERREGIDEDAIASASGTVSDLLKLPINVETDAYRSRLSSADTGL